MAILREGTFGKYYGSTYDNSQGLNNVKQKVNARYITSFLIAKGWTLNAIAGLLGNMQAESSLNPGRWQSEDVGNVEGGYGLVQWTPASKYLNWCYDNLLTDPSEMDNNLNRIIYEVNVGIQWIATDTYNFSFEEFTKSTQSPEYLASAFLKNYERAGVEVEDVRRNNAKTWYEFITGDDFEEIDPIIPNPKKKNGFNFILFNRRRKYL